MTDTLPAPIEAGSVWEWTASSANDRTIAGREIIVDSVTVFENAQPNLRVIDGGEEKIIDLFSFVERVEAGRIDHVATRWETL